MVHRTAAAHAAQVPVAVIGQIDVCWGIGRRRKRNRQFVFVVPTVVDCCVDGSREPFLSVGAGQLKANSDAV